MYAKLINRPSQTIKLSELDPGDCYIYPWQLDIYNENDLFPIHIIVDLEYTSNDIWQFCEKTPNAIPNFSTDTCSLGWDSPDTMVYYVELDINFKIVNMPNVKM